MGQENKQISIKEAFEQAPIVSFSEFFRTENGISTKSWFSNGEVTYELNTWKDAEISIVFYSTGLCKINFSLNDANDYYAWCIRFLDKEKNELTAINFAPIISESNRKRKARPIKLEHRLKDFQEYFFEQIEYLQLINCL
jgi:histidinol phosphatase-like enzyme